MKKYASIAAFVALALAAVGGATYAVLTDPPQRSAARSRPPSAPAGQAVPRPGAPGQSPAPSTGRAIVRPVPPGVPPTGRGPVAHPYVYPGVTAGFWYGWPYPYGYAAYGYPPYFYPWYPWPAYPLAVPDTATGSVRLDVSPTDAAVYVDEYYAGVVKDFNGIFHHLTLTAGPHTIELRKTGFEPLTVAVFVQPDRTITYRAAMSPAQPGSVGEGIEPESAPPPTAGAAMPGPPGDVQFDVTPKDAQVYVDGYYVGIVDDFEGRHQRLSLTPGAHHIELRAQGFEPAEVDVTIQSRQTTTYRAALTRVSSGSTK